jgi:hypothetical protein
MIMRQGFRAVNEVRSLLAKANQTVDAFKGKIEQSVSYLGIMGEGLKKVMEMMAASQGEQGGAPGRRKAHRK